MFVNTIPTPVRIDPDADIGAWLVEFQSNEADARRHAHISLADLQGLTAAKRKLEKIVIHKSKFKAGAVNVKSSLKSILIATSS